MENQILCETISEFCVNTKPNSEQLSLFAPKNNQVSDKQISVIELFAGVGGFRIGLQRASKRFKTIWNNQWEPATKRQDASIIYCKKFGSFGHSNLDISTVEVNEIPDADLLVGGFPCQDYSVATTLKRSGGIEGKKGVLWWQIVRILQQKSNKPKYLFLENVDRLLKSPANQRGRDFAIILASLSDLGYIVEWRIINAAEYGMPQRRRRTYILAYKSDSSAADAVNACNSKDWILKNGVFANAFPCKMKDEIFSDFEIVGDLLEISTNFNIGKKLSPFLTAGIMNNRKVFSIDVTCEYSGPYLTLGELLVDENKVPEEFFITDEQLSKWQYLKGSKHLVRVNKSTGFEYDYSEGSMAFPDYLDRASRTIITGEGGAAPSRFKHVVKTKSGRYRRLLPLELERLNMFPDNHTEGASDLRRAFLMGNALVTGVIEKVGIWLEKFC